MKRLATPFVALLILSTSVARSQEVTSRFVGGMSQNRTGHTATLLADGTVLVAGGSESNLRVHASAELFDPRTQSFTDIGSMNLARAQHTATVLSDGRILIAGGLTNGSTYPKFIPARSAEIFDPATKTFKLTKGPMLITSEYQQQAVLLADGFVLIAGPGDAVLFNPTFETFEPLPRMKRSRVGHSATTLPSGDVLFCGGLSVSSYSLDNPCEVYKRSTRTFESAGLLKQVRIDHVSSGVHADGILLAGPSLSAELHNPTSGVSQELPLMNGTRANARGIDLRDRTLMIGGGSSSIGELYSSNTVEAFDWATKSFRIVGTLSTHRGGGHTATLLKDGSVLVVGGSPAGSATAELLSISSGQRKLGSTIPAVASTPGANNSYFETTVFAYNSTDSPVSAQFVYRPQGTSGVTHDGEFLIPAKSSRVLSNIVSQLGGTGLGSLDMLVPPGEVSPKLLAMVFNRTPDGNTSGFQVEGLRESDALSAGQTGFLFGAPDSIQYRTSIGIRSMSGGARVQFTAVDSMGIAQKEWTTTYAPDYFEQVPLATLLGNQPTSGMVILLKIETGSVLAYATNTDNFTNDPAIQIARSLTQ